MKVLQVNGYESPGRRFNGLSITPLLKKYGIESRHLVWQKDTQNPEILTFEGRISRKINGLINLIERKASLQSVIHMNVSKMIKMPAFQEADLIHLHIIHSGYFAISDLSKITDLKPTIWTLHDPWALTGHCVHPFDCQRWMIGCGDCPNLTSTLPLYKDNTKFLFNYKKTAYRKANFDIIVASKWMQDMVEASPMFENKKTNLVPFGIDLNFFLSEASPNARKLFDIPQDALVICFRADENEFKGLSYIIQALEHIKSNQPICLLTLSSGGYSLKQFADRFQLVDLGWVNDEELLRDALVASDIFLMPSLAEAFGMMAIEAMACSKPVIVFDGTALPDIVFANDNVGVSVAQYDVMALYHAIQNLIDNPDERKVRGQKGRMMAELHYADETQARNLAEIYKRVVER